MTDPRECNCQDTKKAVQGLKDKSSLCKYCFSDMDAQLILYCSKKHKYSNCSFYAEDTQEFTFWLAKGPQ